MLIPADDKQAGERRRRTSGLRREEVAHLAGISSTWYTRLEQGKQVTPSGAALGRIADVLRLAPAERAYLFEVAQRVDPSGASTFAGELATQRNRELRPCHFIPGRRARQILDAAVLECRVGGAVPGWLQGSEKNLLRYMFLDSSVRELVIDWEPRARRLLAQFRVEFGKYIDDPKMLELIQGLSDASDLFRQFWEEQQVLWWEGNEKTFNHPQRGLLTFFQTTFLAAPDPTLKLVILKPCY